MIALVFCGDLKYCPYITRYIERLEKYEIDYRVYFWNRSNFELNLSEKYVGFGHKSDLKKNKFQKLFDFLQFRNWLVNQLNKNQYEKIIILSTLSGIILGQYLNKKKIKYIFDIRDYSYEHILPFYLIERRVIKQSIFTSISSAGFKNFLPRYNYIIAHNFNRKDIIPQTEFIKAGKCINFVWNGVIRYFDFQKNYLNALKNDCRFKIIFHGIGPDLDKYKAYCVKNGFSNVVFTGAYNNIDKGKLLSDANILNNCYGYERRAGNKLKYAVSNRFYDGMIYHIPQLVECSGFKTELVLKSGIGIALKPDEKFADKLYDYYNNIDKSQFDNACNQELERVLNEDNKYIEAIDSFICS